MTDLGDIDGAWSETLTRAEVNRLCGKLEDVQSRADRIARDVRLEGLERSAQGRGAEIHKRLQREIRNSNNPSYRPEVSY